MSTLPGKAAIAGIGQTEFSKESGRTELQLACECVLAALDDAGLAAADVDGLVTFTLDTSEEMEVARNLGMERLTMFARIPYGGGASAATVMQAAMAVATGTAEVVVCYRAFNERSGMRFGNLGGGRRRRAAALAVVVRPVRVAVAGGRGWGCTPVRYMEALRRHERGLRAHRRRSTARTRRRTPTRGSTSGRSPSRTIRPRAGSSSRCSACSTAARRATAGSRWSSRRSSGPGTCASRSRWSRPPRRARRTTAR